MTDLADLITVCVTTSPTASDPSTDTIDRTLASVAGFDEIAHCPVLIGADGIRPEQRALYGAYGEKIQKLCMDGYKVGVLPGCAWGHQANVVRMLLEHVTTPLVLFMEHDTPLTENVQIDWEGCAETVLSGELHSLRFLHESAILPGYEHLMLNEVEGTPPYIRTAQWSQRPHLASTDWYRNLIDTYFSVSSRTMIEDVMHGVVTYQWNTYGRAGLDALFRLAIHSDREPTMQRSTHLDGRAGGNKYEMTFAYPGDSWPEGAPAPTLGRTFE